MLSAPPSCSPSVVVEKQDASINSKLTNLANLIYFTTLWILVAVNSSCESIAVGDGKKTPLMLYMQPRSISFRLQVSNYEDRVPLPFGFPTWADSTI